MKDVYKEKWEDYTVFGFWFEENQTGIKYEEIVGEVGLPDIDKYGVPDQLIIEGFVYELKPI